MTATTRSATQMVLPPHEVTDQSVATRWPHGRDERIPVPLRTRDQDLYSEEHLPQVAGPARRTLFAGDQPGPCDDGRHLFDIIESRVYREVETERPDGVTVYTDEYDFRARLTCVRCGNVDQWEGTRTERHIATLRPAPLVAGGLVAQHVSGSGPDRWQRGDTTSWTIYRDGQPVGRMDWGCTSRGRYYHHARLDEWPQGETVEGKDPAAALRKLARTRVAVTQ